MLLMTLRYDISTMTTRLFLPMIAALALTAVALVSFARSVEIAAGDLILSNAWARATPPGATTGAAYLTIENRGDADDRIVGAASPAASMVMVHETMEEDGVAKMREVGGTIPSGARLEMTPGGTHIMLMGLTAPLKEGDTLDLTISFEKAGPAEVKALVAPIGAEGPTEGMQ